ncbi:TRAP transporter permease [Peptoniphilus catoniae]|uniref:TRAP transporter permease n=1 Tax=Peptoniphilus catoniae TaxID=1660341 RepID=UPI001C55B380|nr:TRAP transporter permease [Peptoniphilus catoniae]
MGNKMNIFLKNNSINKKKLPDDDSENVQSRRDLTGIYKKILTSVCLILAAFQLYAAGSGLVDDSVVMSVHLGFVIFIVFMLFPATKNSSRVKPTKLDLILGILGFCSAMYPAVFAKKIQLQMGIPTQADLIVGAVAILAVLEVSRRALGNALPIVALAFIAFGYFGNYVPGVFKNAGFSLKQIIKLIFLTDEGIFGTALNTSATYVILFIFFGAIMSEIGMSKFLNNLALSVAGRSIGGPAKVSVISSGLMGTISGSTSGNVATTGVMTIPLMKSVGYDPEYAGAVECVSSAGGQIMPPIMGAAAFLMAQFIGVEYGDIVISAIMPALLYYFGVWISVGLRAEKEGLRTLSKDELPDLKDTIKNYGHMAIPLIALIYFLAIKKYSPIFSGWLGILIAVIISFFRKSSRLNILRFIHAMENGVKSALSVATACACAGIVIGMISLTGFGLVFSMNIFKLSMGVLIVALLLSMFASIVLGMGLPTTACYIVTSLTLAPALINMGVETLSAHFFVFYFSIISTITPPVALSAYVAAGLANSDPFKTGIKAFRLAIGGFILPFMFIYKPELLVHGFEGTKIFYSCVIALIGMYTVSVANEGYFKGKLSKVERVVLAACVFGLLIFNWKGDIVGLPVIFAIFLKQYYRHRKFKKENV